MKLCVDDVLPEYFFALIGKYAQTYAYIEQVIWFIICDLQPNKLVTAEELTDFLLIRRNTDAFKSEAAKCCAQLPDELSQDFAKCLRDLNDRTPYRNTVIHGAWSMGSDERNFSVDYIYNNGTKRAPDVYLLYDTDFSIETVLLEIDILDSLLRRFAQVRRDVSHYTKAPPDAPAVSPDPADCERPGP